MYAESVLSARLAQQPPCATLLRVGKSGSVPAGPHDPLDPEARQIDGRQSSAEVTRATPALAQSGPGGGGGAGGPFPLPGGRSSVGKGAHRPADDEQVLVVVDRCRE